VRNEALAMERIRAVETGGCPHAAIREDISHNLLSLERLMREVKPAPELLFVESTWSQGRVVMVSTDQKPELTKVEAASFSSCIAITARVPPRVKNPPKLIWPVPRASISTKVAMSMSSVWPSTIVAWRLPSRAGGRRRQGSMKLANSTT